MKKRMAYICSVRKELYDNPELGTCRKCGHTYHHGETCGNCHSAKIGKTMKPTGTTMKIAMEIWQMGIRYGELRASAEKLLRIPKVWAALRLFESLPEDEQQQLITLTTKSKL
jgi:predicted RNA-binding protein